MDRETYMEIYTLINNKSLIAFKCNSVAHRRIAANSYWYILLVLQCTKCYLHEQVTPCYIPSSRQSAGSLVAPGQKVGRHSNQRSQQY